jgi:hypothetical protein
MKKRSHPTKAVADTSHRWVADSKGLSPERSCSLEERALTRELRSPMAPPSISSETRRGTLQRIPPENRTLIESVVKSENYVRTGSEGDVLYREILPNGT